MKRSGKGDRFAEAVVGVFMVVVIALLAYFTIVISGVDVLAGRSRMKVRIAFSEVGGLKTHDNVMYRGTKVGTVESVKVQPTNLVVTVDVDREVVLRERYRIAVCNQSLLGGNYLLLEEGEGEKIALDEGTLNGETPTDWMRDVQEIARNFKEISGMSGLKGIVTNTAAATEKFNGIVDKTDAFVDTANELIARVQKGEGTLGKLLSKEDTAYENIRRTMANAAEISERIKNGEGVVGRLLSKDDRLYEDLKAGVASFRKACEGFNLEDMKGDAKDVVASARQLLGSLNEVVDRVKRGEGTLGKLTAADDKMYDEVNGLIRDVRQVIDNYRDTTPISTFTSLATGAL